MSMEASVSAEAIPAALPKPFIRLAWSNLAAQSAEQIALAAAPIAAVLLLGADASGTGFLQSVQTLPFLLLSIPAGMLADRRSRARLLTAAEALRCLSLIGILLLVGFGQLTLPLLAILGFLGAAGTVAYNVAAPALIPALVPRDGLIAANRRFEIARSLAFTAGPAVGGALVGLVGAAPAFALAALLSFAAVCLLTRVEEPPRTLRASRGIFRDLSEGVSFSFTHPLLRPIILTAIVFNFAWFVLQAIYAAYAIRSLGLSGFAVGLTLAAYGAGMVIGALIAPRVAAKLTFGQVICVGPLAGASAAAIMAATLLLPSGWLAGLAFFLLGVGPILWTIYSTTLRQVVTPSSHLGRVSALLSTATMGARPLGALVGTLVAANFGVEACLIVAMLGFFAQAAIILTSAPARLTHLPEPVKEN